MTETKNQEVWTEGIRAKLAIDDLRVYLKQFSLFPLGTDDSTAECVRDRVIFLLDEYRQLRGQKNDQILQSICSLSPLNPGT